MRDIDNIVSKKLPKSISSPCSEWRMWEAKTFNVHRGVLLWRPEGTTLSMPNVEELVREKVKACFKRSWWRGFAFGVILDLQSMTDGLETINDSIDIRKNGKGTWQWTILSIRDAQNTVGVHTWIKGWLTPVYQDLMAYYEGCGHRVGSFKKEKGKVLELLTAVAKLGTLPGTGRLPEFDPNE
jgi:hypothetical protein